MKVKFERVTDHGFGQKKFDVGSLLSQVLMMSGSHSMVQYTRTTVMWPWRTLVKVMMLCSAWLNNQLVADLLLVTPQETGTFPMELEFLAVVASGTSTEQEVIWRYFCRGGEVERMEFTAVRYLMSWMSLRPYTLECTQQALVSGTCMLIPPTALTYWD